MTLRTFMLSVATPLATFGAAHATRAAAPAPEVNAYLQGAHQAAAARTADVTTGLRRSLTVKGHVNADGRIYDAHVVRSSGSLADDVRIAGALRRLKTPEPPIGLIGAAVTLNVNPPALAQAAR